MAHPSMPQSTPMPLMPRQYQHTPQPYHPMLLHQFHMVHRPQAIQLHLVEVKY